MQLKTINIQGLVLAAGEGKRLGRPKALIEIDGVSFLKRVIDSLSGGGIRTIRVVGGANGDEVKLAAMDLNVDFVLNDSWRKGQFSSLKAGIASLPDLPHGLMIALVDYPFVKPQTCGALAAAFKENSSSIIIPSYRNRRGHPIVIPGALIDEIKESPLDSNLRQIINRHPEQVVEIPVEDAGVLKDIDTPADLKGAIET